MAKRSIMSILILLALTCGVALADVNVPSDSVMVGLRAQIGVMERYDQRLLATVYWSLGVITTIAALMIGFGWFANFRVYQRDKESLLAELTGNVASEMGRVQGILATNLGQELKGLTENKMASHDVQIAQLEHRMARLKMEMERGFSDARYRYYEQEARRWRSAGVLSNALRACFHMLDEGLLMEDDFYISRGLDDINQTLADLAETKGPFPDASDLGRFSETLGKVPATHALVLQTTRERLGAIWTPRNLRG